MPTSLSSGLAYGPAEIKGKLELIEGQVLKGPLSKQKCSYYRYRVTERRGSGKNRRTVVIEDRNERVKFFCRDREGVTLVDPEGADVTAEVKKSRRSGRRTYREWNLASGEDLYLLGSAVVEPERGIIAIGSGGINGKGFQEGSQAHLDFLPEAETDFIFAVVAEEFGFIGVCILLSIFFFILLRCLYLAFNARDRFCRLTIGGLSLVFASTLFINLSMVAGIIPVVGMPLPFISKGGSSLLSFYLAFGIIISMATHKKLMQR